MMRLAVVVIGRNEGERLGRCLDALASVQSPIVYVDSGSSDGSPDRARRAGATVVLLDPARPFTAGRARNEGFAAVLERLPDAEVVQFVDGDCELVEGWLSRAEEELRARPRVAALCGRVRERERNRTIYNRICDMEWDAPAGETRACGGNMLMRATAFRESGGFRPGLIAGEEPDLCFRLRGADWTIFRVDQDMVFHDAAMTSFAQWWRRSIRTGWSFAEGASIHGASRERHKVREMRSAWFWGGLLPAAALVLAVPAPALSLLLLAGYALLLARVYVKTRRRGLSGLDSLLLAAFTVIGKFPQVVGQLQFRLLRARGKARSVIDWRAGR
jgi:glycosyltransferase involved in cell wall biosynthesis